MTNLVTWLACRPRKHPVRLVVLHSTAGKSASGAISWLRKIKLSYHILVKDQAEGDGDVVKCVPLDRVAFHAGVSTGPPGTTIGNSVNETSIGISLVNANDGQDPYSAKQFATVVRLLNKKS